MSSLLCQLYHNKAVFKGVFIQQGNKEIKNIWKWFFLENELTKHIFGKMNQEKSENK